MTNLKKSEQTGDEVGNLMMGLFALALAKKIVDGSDSD